MRACILGVIVTLGVVGCAMFGPGRPPTEACWIAIRSYSALLETATEWYEENPAGEDERKAIRSVIEGARPFRQTCQRLARGCEAWALQTGGSVSECPQATKMSSAATGLTTLVSAANAIMEEYSDDAE